MAAGALQWGRLGPLLAVQFTESFSQMVITPLLPFIVRDFFPDMPTAHIGSTPSPDCPAVALRRVLAILFLF